MRQIMRQEGERHQIKMQNGVTERDFIRLGEAVSSKTGECQSTPLNGQERHSKVQFQADLPQPPF